MQVRSLLPFTVEESSPAGEGEAASANPGVGFIMPGCRHKDGMTTINRTPGI
jgi:hypothetical protein